MCRFLNGNGTQIRGTSRSVMLCMFVHQQSFSGPVAVPPPSPDRASLCLAGPMVSFLGASSPGGSPSKKNTKS
eukprot:4485309-Alexandrium_andersonii.AAC.1